MVNTELLLIQIINTEAACKLYLQECRKLKELLGENCSPTKKRTKLFTREMSARVVAKRRLNILGKIK